jgi:branched-subunit amino acid transport protein AzlD
MSLGAPEIILILFVIFIGGFALCVLPYWFIFRKAGFAPALSLLMLIPFVNIAMLFFLAFAEWPILNKQQKQGGT